jgi:hypothetical protein
MSNQKVKLFYKNVLEAIKFGEHKTRTDEENGETNYIYSDQLKLEEKKDHFRTPQPPAIHKKFLPLL